MDKKISYIIISFWILIIVVLSCFCFKKYNVAQEYQEKIAMENIDDWLMLYEMTKTVDENFVQNPDWKEVDTLDWYVSGVTAHTVSGTIPRISGGSTETTVILGTRYAPVFRELTRDRIPDMYKAELFQIFCEMNMELHDICSYVIDTCGDNAEKQLELITEGSELYDKVSKELKDFCDTYEKKCNDYFKKYDF